MNANKETKTKPCTISVVQRTLERKLAEEKEICAWFENEYSPAITDEDEVKEWDKKGIEVHAQIKLLRFIIANWE